MALLRWQLILLLLCGNLVTAHAEKRYANDGKSYTRSEFIEWYGKENGIWHWDRAATAEEEPSVFGFALAAFFLLGIERFLYGFIYHCPEQFKSLCHGPLKQIYESSDNLYWQVAEKLGVIIKVFQFGVIAYDFLLRDVRGSVAGLALILGGDPLKIAGLVLAAIGQLLNVATFKAIGGMGVYYGKQLGYETKWCNGFPYNLGISDPQYWGVILFVWGFYLVFTPSGNVFGAHFVVPWLETFWYIVSMKLLESSWWKSEEPKKKLASS